MTSERLQILLNKFNENTCSVEELLELENWYSSLNIDNQLIGDDIGEIFSEEMLAKFRQKISLQRKVIPFYRSYYFYAAAVIISIFLSIGGYFQFFYFPKQVELVKSNVEKSKDIGPGGNKAILTLADGTSIILDSTSNGLLSQQGNSKIIKLENGQIAYNATKGISKEALYNTITTPIGGQYEIILADGTKVWLNAASSLRFPASFIGNERNVTLNGEAYFEVAKNTRMPFIVNIANKGKVEVLGTHFNINSYPEESSINITLLEGKVKVNAIDFRGTEAYQQILLPGSQAQINTQGEININNNPDIDEVIAWKNGKFQFGDNVDMKSMMRQIARWYGVEVEFNGEVSKHIGGTISRNVNISKVLEMLEITGAVKFKMEEKKIIVMPNKK